MFNSLNIDQKQIVVNDLLIQYYEYKPEKSRGETLLFLHGWRSESPVWFSIIDLLKDRGYHIVCIDLPGFGKSEKPLKTYSTLNYAKIVVDLIQKLNLENIHIIGHSFGGSLCIKISAENAHIFKSITLLDSSGIRQNSSSKQAKKTFAKIVKPFFKPSFMKPLRNKIYKIMGYDDYLATPELQETYKQVIGEDMTPLLSSIKTRTLIVWGDKDLDTPIEMAKILHQEIGEAQLFILNDVGHFSFLEKPKEFSEALIKFIEE